METHWAGVINKVILADADTSQLKGVEEELLSSSQQRSQKLDANPFLKPPSLEKQTSDLKHTVHPINLKSTDDALPLGFFSQILAEVLLMMWGAPELRKLLKSLVVTEEECHLQWAGRQEQNIPVLCVITQPMFNQLHYIVCDVALQHPVQYGWQQSDSRAPLACLSTWTLAGVVSWEDGCARGWDTIRGSTMAQGSPGIFFWVAAFTDFIAQSVAPVPEDKIILIRFTKLYVEYPVECDCVPLFKQKRADQFGLWECRNASGRGED
ncbi:hypothetical protein AV530_010873 [Patagioenas fasciata monilis]|uniref:Uncharacterized protein n=1 Tax=Patagioenas fasciata monilis TaxID=372326 RepID=A0A1V4K817_PATFA|nr:hypothetical protein AV530_010873 [Patagioenas fasciata monilis]